MAKTNEELNELKQEYESLATKLQELTEDELKQVAGGYPDPQGEYLTFNSLDNQTEKISILKDASSTAIYGSKGSN